MGDRGHESGGREEDPCAPVAAGDDALSVLEPAELDSDPIAAFMAAIVVFEGSHRLLLAGHSGEYALVFQSFPKAVGTWQTATKRLRADVVVEASS